MYDFVFGEGCHDMKVDTHAYFSDNENAFEKVWYRTLVNCFVKNVLTQAIFIGQTPIGVHKVCITAPANCVSLITIPGYISVVTLIVLVQLQGALAPFQLAEVSYADLTETLKIFHSHYWQPLLVTKAAVKVRKSGVRGHSDITRMCTRSIWIPPIQFELFVLKVIINVLWSILQPASFLMFLDISMYLYLLQFAQIVEMGQRKPLAWGGEFNSVPSTTAPMCSFLPSYSLSTPGTTNHRACFVQLCSLTAYPKSTESQNGHNSIQSLVEKD